MSSNTQTSDSLPQSVMTALSTITAPADTHQISHAINDLRRGWGIGLAAQSSTAQDHHKQACHLILPVETLHDDSLAATRALGPVFIAITIERATVLRVSTAVENSVLIPVPPHWTVETLRAIADPTLDLASPLKGPFQAVLSHDAGIPSSHAQAATSLLKMARMLPAALVVTAAPDVLQHANILTLDAPVIKTISSGYAATVAPIIQTTVQLHGAEECQIQVFRPDDGGEEHLALIIGKPDVRKPTLVRIHSSCLTGDIFGSLRCDCGPQLQGAIQKMAQESGVILYLQQEGRGIGFLNKMRAYTLQHQGHDTVDANERLGFQDDERDFAPAAQMLNALGIQDVRLLTNNPRKVDSLARFGVHVSERVAHHFESNPHNAHYLDTKAKRSGHYLPAKS